MKILIATACGAKKNREPMAAHRLYKSARIKAVYNRRLGNDMGILSAEHGLLDAQEITEPYERIMDEKRALELIPSVAEQVREYDCVIFYKGGARKSYMTCIKGACEKAKKTLVLLGFANMGGINDLPKAIELVSEGEWSEISNLHHAEVLYPTSRAPLF